MGQFYDALSYISRSQNALIAEQVCNELLAVPDDFGSTHCSRERNLIQKYHWRNGRSMCCFAGGPSIGWQDMWRETMLRSRPGTPRDIAPVVSFALSDGVK